MRSRRRFGWRCCGRRRRVITAIRCRCRGWQLGWRQSGRRGWGDGRRSSRRQRDATSTTRKSFRKRLVVRTCHIIGIGFGINACHHGLNKSATSDNKTTVLDSRIRRVIEGFLSIRTHLASARFYFTAAVRRSNGLPIVALARF